MKKILLTALSVMLVFSLASCGEKAPDDPGLIEEPVVASEPLSPEPGSITVGSYTLSAEFLPFEEPFETTASGDPDMTVYGDTVYVGDGGSTVKVYTLSDGALTYVKTLNISCRNGIQTDANGNLYADGGVFEAKVYDADGNETGAAAASGTIAVSKTEDFALTYWPGRDEVTKIAGGAAEPWVIAGMNSGGSIFTTVSEIEIQDGHVLVGGEDSDKYLMAAYDMAGTQIAVSTEPLKGTLPNAICETANGYICTAVYNMNFIAPDGSMIGSDNDSETLFGVDGTFWIRNLTPLPDGTVLVCASCRRPDDKDEILVYKLSGF